MTKEVRIGVAWFESEQWEELKAVSADSSILETTYEEWHSNILKTLGEMNSGGLIVHKVKVNIAELVKWSKERGVQIDAQVRSEFVAQKLKEFDKTGI